MIRLRLATNPVMTRKFTLFCIFLFPIPLKKAAFLGGRGRQGEAVIMTTCAVVVCQQPGAYICNDAETHQRMC